MRSYLKNDSKKYKQKAMWSLTSAIGGKRQYCKAKRGNSIISGATQQELLRIHLRWRPQQSSRATGGASFRVAAQLRLLVTVSLHDVTQGKTATCK